MKSQKRGSEIIAFVCGQDYAGMAGARYQATRSGDTPVYVLGDDYYCCPTAKQKLPNDFGKWEAIATEYGRTVYRAKASDVDEDDDKRS